MKRICTLIAAILFATTAYGQGTGTVANHAYAIGKGPGVAGYTSLLCGTGQLALGSATDPTCRTMSGDATINAAGVLTLATVNANVGTFGSATQCVTVTYDAKGRATAVSAANCTPAVGSITGLGTGIAAALAINVGSAGAPVLFNGAGGTPSSIVLTNGTNLPLGSVTGLGAGCATFLGTPSSANLRGCMTDETGTALLYFQGGDIGTPSAGVGTNLTALNATQLNAGTVPAARMPALTGDCTSTVGTVATTCTGINGVNQNAAYTPYTPTITCTQATGTAVCTGAGRSKTLGKTIFVSVNVTVSGVFTGGAITVVPLPTAAATVAGFTWTLAGRESAIAGVTWAGTITSGATSTFPFTATNSNVITSGMLINLEGWYELP